MLAVGEARIGYDEAGEGPPVVLVHAGCADRRMWVHQLDALAGQHRVIAYDWRGYGESDAAHAPVSRHADLLAVLDAVAEERAVVVGASDGGRAALDAALVAPERITALVLIAPGLSGYTWPAGMLRLYRDRVHMAVGVDRLQAYRTGSASRIEPADLDTYSRAETQFLVAGPDRTAADLPQSVWQLALTMDRKLNRRAWSTAPIPEAVLDPPAVGRLAEVTVPTLVVNGLGDVPQIIDLGRIIAGQIPGATHLELPDTRPRLSVGGQRLTRRMATCLHYGRESAILHGRVGCQGRNPDQRLPASRPSPLPRKVAVSGPTSAEAGCVAR